MLVLTFLFGMELCHGWVTAGKSGNSCAGWKTSILQLDNASMASGTIKSAHNAPSLTSQLPWSAEAEVPDSDDVQTTVLCSRCSSF